MARARKTRKELRCVTVRQRAPRFRPVKHRPGTRRGGPRRVFSVLQLYVCAELHAPAAFRSARDAL